MVRLAFAAALLAAGFAVAAPTVPVMSDSFSLPDGFPNPNPQQLLEIEREADGVLSNAPPPPKLANSSLTAFQLIAFNENFEVSFFSSLLKNITESHKDDFRRVNQKELANVIKTVLAQEELHAITAKNILNNFGAFAPPPCEYKFPTDTVFDAIELASTFTAVVLGTLQDASQLLAKNGDDGPVRAIASVIGQEGEQNGFYRTLLDRKPSEKPFLTTSVAPFAFSVLVQNFVVSCPFPLAKIDLPVFAPLTVVSGNGGKDVAPKDQRLTFSVDLADFGGADEAKKYYDSHMRDGLFITYFTGQQVPISEPVGNAQLHGSKVTFDAFFPFEANVMEALSIAALTTRSNFTDPDDVPSATLAAPGLIQVNDKL